MGPTSSFSREASLADDLRSVETIDVVADEVTEFASCVRHGTRPETGGSEGLEATAVLQSVAGEHQIGAPG